MQRKLLLIILCSLSVFGSYAETPPVSLPPFPPVDRHVLTIPEYILLTVGAIIFTWFVVGYSKKEVSVPGYSKNEKGTWRTHSMNWKNEEENK